MCLFSVYFIWSFYLCSFTASINRSEELSQPEPYCLMSIYLPADLTFTQMDLQLALKTVSLRIVERIIILLNE